MDLLFLGTRANTRVRGERHRMQSSLLVELDGRRVMIDCGDDWKDETARIAPHAVVLTHAHWDHARGLESGCSCPVFAALETWDLIRDYPLERGGVIAPRTPLEVEGLLFEAFPVDHSTRCPAVGYRIAAAGAVFFYVPDVVAIHERADALRAIGLFAGDAASLKVNGIYRHGNALNGHTTVRAQLGWCRDKGVRRAIFTHCGAEVLADERGAARLIQKWGAQNGVEASLAWDGLRITL